MMPTGLLLCGFPTLALLSGFPHLHCCSAVFRRSTAVVRRHTSVSDRKVNTFPANSQPLPKIFSLVPAFSGVSKAAPQ